jgi:protein subunit release factor A
LTLHQLYLVLEGDALDELIDALIAEHQTELLSAMQEEGHA